MPEYEFRTPTGEIVTEFYLASEAPEPGDQVTINGVECTRIFSVPNPGATRDYTHTAHSLPPWDPAAPRHDDHGQPVFVSRKEIDEYASKTGRIYR